FALEGYKVAFTGRDQEKMQQVVHEMREMDGHSLAIIGDVANEADCRRSVEETINHFGRLDVVICNAGISMRAMFTDTDLNVLKKLMDVNFWGTVYTVKYALPFIIQSKGSVVGISSIAGYRGLPGRTGYSASKFAMQGFLESLRTEMIPHQVHVLVACPGFTSSNIRNVALTADGSPQGDSPREEDKMMTAEEVAGYIISAVKKRKRDIILTTQGKVTVWLNRLLPGLADKLVFNHMAKEDNSPLK
ncbi:MAG: SDR family oxidoreductase, partial [Chitinophagaceae bacterium]